MRGKYLNQEERRFVCDSYLSGQGMPAIRKKMGVGGSTISRILREGGVRARTKSESMTIEMKGKRFGRWVVLGWSDRRSPLHRHSRWLCRCDCGVEKTVDGMSLRNGDSTSCGCFARESATIHGMTGTTEYTMWRCSKARAMDYGVEWSIDVTDIHIPKTCPALGIPIAVGDGAICANSPTIDRIDPKGGYTKDNICVISAKANLIKSNATAEELEKVAAYVRRMRKGG